MRILRPRQRCETCNGEGRIDYFGLLSKVECSSCHGTGYSRKLPPLEYVHPDLAYALQRPSDSQSETSRVFKEVVHRKQSPRRKTGQGTKERVQSQVAGVQSDKGLFSLWDIPHSGA